MPVPEFPPFEPHRLLRGSHLMTLALMVPRRLARSAPGGEEQRFRVEPDSEVLGLLRRQPGPAPRPGIVIVHGLSGDATSSYMVGIAAKAHRAGFHTLRLNVRNCGGSEHLTPTLYHAGLTADLAAVARQLVQGAGWSRVYLAGYSLGGNLVLKCAGEWGAQPPAYVGGVAGVSAAVDLARCSQAIDGDPAMRLYQRQFVRDLRALVRRKAAVLPGSVDLRGLRQLRSIRAYDERYTAPGFGFAGADDYYRQASALPLLPRIRVPGLLIHARDDRFVPFASVDRPEVHGNPDLHLLATAHGGHCAFIGQRPASGPDYADRDRHWAENRVLQFFEWLEAQRGT